MGGQLSVLRGQALAWLDPFSSILSQIGEDLLLLATAYCCWSLVCGACSSSPPRPVAVNALIVQAMLQLEASTENLAFELSEEPQFPLLCRFFPD